MPEDFSQWAIVHERMDSEQTVMLVVISVMLAVVAIAVIYALWLLRVELRRAGASLSLVITTQAQLQENVRRVWERIDALEARHGIQGDADTFMRMKRLLEALEGGQPPPRTDS